MGREDKHYFLYGFGHPVEQLCLGHLCFGSTTYSTPTKYENWYCNAGLLSEFQISEVAYVTEVENLSLQTSNWSEFSFSVNFYELVTVGPSINRSKGLLVKAKTGRKVELKEPKDFFLEKVLRSEHAQGALQRWLTVANPNIKRLVSRPKVWFLTGLYELEDATCYTNDDKQFSVGADVSSIIAELAGPGVPGVAAQLGRGSSTVGSFQVKGKRIWAAKFQRIDARYLKLGKSDPSPPLCVAIEPMPVWSDGNTRPDDDDERSSHNCVELVLDDLYQDPTAASMEEEGKEYWSELEMASNNYTTLLEWAD